MARKSVVKVKPKSKPPARKPRAPKAVDILKAEAAAAQILPLDYMMMVLNALPPVREPGEPPEAWYDRLDAYETRRLDAAKAAAPYIHSKPVSVVKLETPPEDDRPVDIRQLARKLSFLLTVRTEDAIDQEG
ncbi:MAG: hypothetical protein VW362_04585 [Candidatus Nanopelagicales bacterium]